MLPEFKVNLKLFFLRPITRSGACSQVIQVCNQEPDSATGAIQIALIFFVFLPFTIVECMIIIREKRKRDFVTRSSVKIPRFRNRIKCFRDPLP